MRTRGYALKDKYVHQNNDDPIFKINNRFFLIERYERRIFTYPCPQYVLHPWKSLDKTFEGDEVTEMSLKEELPENNLLRL